MQHENRQVEVGLRLAPETGLSFFGMDEVNKLLATGAKVTALEPVGALTRQFKDNDGNTQITLSGFSMMVKFEEESTE